MRMWVTMWVGSLVCMWNAMPVRPALACVLHFSALRPTAGLNRRTMMMRMWVTMGMYVSFAAPSLTLRRCPCVICVSCNIDCIDTHTCENVTVLWFRNCVMLCTQVAHSDFVLSGKFNKTKDMCC